MDEEKEKTALLVDLSGDRLDRTGKQETAKAWCVDKGFKFLGTLSITVDVSRNAGKSMVNSKLYRFASVFEQLSMADYIVLDEESYCMTVIGTIVKQVLDFCDAHYDIVHLDDGIDMAYCFADITN